MARDLQNSFVHLPPWLEGGGYLIEFPDLPGCMSDGETPEEEVPSGTLPVRLIGLNYNYLQNSRACRYISGAVARLYTEVHPKTDRSGV